MIRNQIDDRFTPVALAKFLADRDANHTDPVTNPAHYTAGAIECFDAIREALTADEFRGYCKGNVIKYVWRERLKGGDEDLNKAIRYLSEAAK